MELHTPGRSPSLESTMTGETPVNLFGSNIDNTDINNSTTDISGPGFSSTATVRDGKSGSSDHSDILSSDHCPSFFNFYVPWSFQDLPLYGSYHSTRIADPTEQFKFIPNWPLEFSSDQQRLSSTTTETFAKADFDHISPSNGDLSSSLIPKCGSDHKETTHATDSREQLQTAVMSHHLQWSLPQSTSSLEYATKEDETSNFKSDTDDSMRSRKRKVAAVLDHTEDEDQDEDSKADKRTCHNDVEKRYRRRINDKFAVLRDSIPSLRAVFKSTHSDNKTQNREKLHGLSPAKKVNKAIVLCKATEYIQHLETRNCQLSEQNNAMQERLTAFENIFNY